MSLLRLYQPEASRLKCHKPKPELNKIPLFIYFFIYVSVAGKFIVCLVSNFHVCLHRFLTWAGFFFFFLLKLFTKKASIFARIFTLVLLFLGFHYFNKHIYFLYKGYLPIDKR
ncbi:hypothetical protein RJT34_10590 [Clitoria ternatea]|uniref:Uncharacterized protein n=1 Tax=Clitoria ternatea TaxID=43366 RepID=A0AAN9K891_CLITE